MATLDTVTELASFERRGAGTDAERRAARWLAGEVGHTGREVRVETFWCRPNWALSHAWHVALALAGSLVSTSAPHVGIVMLTVSLVSVIADAVTGRSLGRRLTPERASQNVVATRPTTAAMRLILVANYDAGRTGLIYRSFSRAAATRMQRLAGPLALGWLAWLSLAIVWLLAVAAVRAGGHDDTAVNFIQIPPSVALVLALAALLETAASPPGPAAGDNGSGTAVAVALTRALDAAPPRQLAVDLVLEGAGDGDGSGLRRYLRARRRELDRGNTVVLGIAASGAGTPRWWRSDGALIPLRYSRRMDELCAQVAAEQAHLRAASHRGRGAGAAFPGRQRRLPAMTIGCLEPTGRSPRSHQAGDQADTVDGAALDRATQFGLILVDAIDAFLAGQDHAPDAVPTPA